MKLQGCWINTTFGSNHNYLMTKEKLKKLLDLIPLLILTVYGVILVANYLALEYGFQWQNILALAILPVNYGMFAWKHKPGVLALGLTLFIGLIGFLSYDLIIIITTLSFGKSDFLIPFFYGQPIFLLWLLIHFIISGRYYVGILTKKYWDDLTKPQTS